MNNLVGLFDALYSRLLLRDVFGKILPGTVVIFSVIASFYSVTQIKTFLLEMNFWFWLIFLGAAWISAFAVQSLGEFLKLIRYHNKDSHEEFYKERYEFDNCVGVDSPERLQLERLVVIKEACGNSYLALSIGALIRLLDYFVNKGCGVQFITSLKDMWHLLLLFIVLVISLARMHFEHVKRQDLYMKTILNRCKELKNK